MLAYVELIQRKEKEIGCDVLTHQKWYVQMRRKNSIHDHPPLFYRSGANYIDRILSSKRIQRMLFRSLVCR
jgi:isocitrate lyase